MKLQLLKTWDRVRSGFWFLPTAMAVGAVAFSYATVALDTHLASQGTRMWSWVYTGGAEGASAVLTAISGSMITIAGLVFSMTLVAMSLAASNFGPRLLQNFMRDTANQVVLGTFVATFLYGLLVLRTIRRADEGMFVPHVSVSLGVLFALTSLGVLIYFIHHVAVSIQADEIVARVGEELIARVETLFPERLGRGSAAVADLPRPRFDGKSFDLEARDVPATSDGYLQLVDAEGLLELATRENAIFRIRRSPGQYIVAGSPLVSVWPPERMTDVLAEALTAAFVLGTQRTAAQDIEYPVGQLVEIAVRALSPGINDPFTAMTCVDRLSSALNRLARREMPSPYRHDAERSLRVIVEGTTFAAVLNTAFDPIRRYGRGSAEVTLRLLNAITVIACPAVGAENCDALRRQAALIVRGRSALAEHADRREVRQRYNSVVRVLRDALVSAGRESE